MDSELLKASVDRLKHVVIERWGRLEDALHELAHVIRAGEISLRHRPLFRRLLRR